VGLSAVHTQRSNTPLTGLVRLELKQAVKQLPLITEMRIWRFCEIRLMSLPGSRHLEAELVDRPFL
jgi:hypothetical protein